MIQECLLCHTIADIVAQRYGGHVSVKESNGHLAVTMHLLRRQ